MTLANTTIHAGDAPPAICIHWLDDPKIARLFLRTRFRSVRRTGLVRLLNFLRVTLLLPLNIVHQLVMFPMFLIAMAYMRLRWRDLKSRGVSAPDALRQSAVRVPVALQRISDLLPTTWIFNLISSLTKHRKYFHYFDNRPTVLYLRPFRMDNRVALTPISEEQSIEKFIAFEMSRIGPLVAIGDDTEVLESSHRLASLAIRIPATESSWVQCVRRELAACGTVLVVPEDTPGTMQELEIILADAELLSKAIFLNIGTAGRDHPYFARARLKYDEDDGKTFLDTLRRIKPSLESQFPSVQEIACAFLKSAELHLICGKTYMDVGLWSASAKIAFFIKKG